MSNVHHIRRILACMCAAPCLLFLSGPSTAQPIETRPIEMSLASMILFALNDSPDISMAEEREIQAHHSIGEAKAPLYPQLDVSLKGGYQYNNPASGKLEKKSNYNWTNSAALTLRQVIFDGFSTVEDVRRRRVLEKASKIETEAISEDIISDTVRYYLETMRYQAVVANTEGFVNRLATILSNVNLMAEEGAASQAKLDYANSRMSSAKTQLTDAITGLNEALSNLEFLTGKLPNFIAIPPEDLIIEENELYDYLEFSREHNSQVVLNQENIKALAHQLNTEKGGFSPDLDFKLEARKSHNEGGEVGPDTSVNALFEMRYKIFDRLSRRSKVGRVQSQINELRINEQKIIKELRREVNQLYNQTTSIQSSLETTEEEIKANESLQELNQKNFEFGEIDIIELIEGEERLIRARNRKAELISDLYKNSYDLLIIVGLMDKHNFCAQC